jgi:[ribosomal protein S5]-alanine N-acetyltransferase
MTAMAGPPNIQLTPRLTTARLALRELTLEDADWYVTHFSRPEIVSGQGYPAPDGLEGAREELRRFVIDLAARGTGGRWGIAPKGHEALIGSVGFYDLDHETRSAEIGYDLVAEHWGRGLMREALTAVIDYCFEHLDLNRLQALVMPRNVRSKQLLTGLGFVYEGLLRQHGVDETGQLCDDAVYALLRSDWRPAALRQRHGGRWDVAPGERSGAQQGVRAGSQKRSS